MVAVLKEATTLVASLIQSDFLEDAFEVTELFASLVGKPVLEEVAQAHVHDVAHRCYPSAVVTARASILAASGPSSSQVSS